MIIRTIILVFTGTMLVVVQSVFFAKIMPLGLVPDLALLFILFTSWRNGPLLGIICGFCIGIACDSLGLAPLGMHAFFFTLLGYLYAQFCGNIGSRGIIFPIIAAAIATGLKYTCVYLFSWLLQMNSGIDRFINMKTLYETGINAVTAPFFFQICFIITQINKKTHRGFH